MFNIQLVGPITSIIFRITIIIIVSIFLERTLRFLIGRVMKRSAALMNMDQTRYVFLKHLATGIIYTFAAISVIYSIPQFKTLAVSLFAGAGIIAAIIGFASQAAFSNIISGVFMVISRPFKVGDRIEVGVNFTGVVEDITLRHTVIRNFENRRIVIPNSKISSEIIINANLYDDEVRKYIDVSVEFTSDIEHVMRVLREECEMHPLCIDRRNPKQMKDGLLKVDIKLISLENSELKFRAYPWAANVENAFDLHMDLNVRIKNRFDREGISFPEPRRIL
jgi:small conductance mechanosensitive channel